MEVSDSSSTQEALLQEDRKFLAIVESGIWHVKMATMRCPCH